jgi:alpha-1,6-mannosyltransferase
VAPISAVWLGVLNPLVLLHLVTDAHNDALMLGLLSIGLVCALERRPALGTIAVTLAALVKAPAGLAIAFLVSIWASQLTGRSRWAWATAGTAAVAAVTAVAATALAGTGYGWVAALDTPARAHTWLSITTDLGYITGMGAQWLGVAGVVETTDAWRLAGLAVAAILCVLLWRRSAQIGPVTALGLGLAAVVMLGPVVHPWYLLWGVVPLAATARSRAIRRAVTVLSAALVLLVLPAGVEPGMSALAGAVLGTAAVLVVLLAVRARALPISLQEVTSAQRNPNCGPAVRAATGGDVQKHQISTSGPVFE